MIKKQVNYYLKNYKINRMKHRAELGTLQDDTGVNGVPYQKFQSSNIFFWYGEYRVNESQNTVNATETPIQNIKAIAVKHDFVQKHIDIFNTFNVIKLSDGVFTILSINSDDQVNGLDVLTIQHSTNEGIQQT